MWVVLGSIIPDCFEVQPWTSISYKGSKLSLYIYIYIVNIYYLSLVHIYIYIDMCTIILWEAALETAFRSTAPPRFSAAGGRAAAHLRPALRRCGGAPAQRPRPWSAELGVYTYTHIYNIRVYTYIYMHAYIRTSIHPAIHTYIHTFIHPYIHTHIYIYISTSASTYTYVSLSLSLSLYLYNIYTHIL